MSVSRRSAASILANKKREEVASKTYIVERLLKHRERKVTDRRSVFRGKTSKSEDFSLWFSGPSRIFSQMETLGSNLQFLGARR